MWKRPQPQMEWPLGVYKEDSVAEGFSAVRGKARAADNTRRGFTAKTRPGGGVGLWGMGQAAWKI